MSTTIVKKIYATNDPERQIEVCLDYRTGKGYIAWGYTAGTTSTGLRVCYYTLFNPYSRLLVACSRSGSRRAAEARKLFEQCADDIARQVADGNNLIPGEEIVQEDNKK